MSEYKRIVYLMSNGGKRGSFEIFVIYSRLYFFINITYQGTIKRKKFKCNIKHMCIYKNLKSYILSPLIMYKPNWTIETPHCSENIRS